MILDAAYACSRYPKTVKFFSYAWLEVEERWVFFSGQSTTNIWLGEFGLHDLFLLAFPLTLVKAISGFQIYVHLSEEPSWMLCLRGPYDSGCSQFYLYSRMQAHKWRRRMTGLVTLWFCNYRPSASMSVLFVHKLNTYWIGGQIQEWSLTILSVKFGFHETNFKRSILNAN